MLFRSRGCEKVISYVRQKNGANETTKLSVTVPAGVKSGQRLKLSNEGDQPQGTQPGDLYVVVSLAEHPLFKRKDNDVTLDLPLSFVDAILGAEVKIPTLTGHASLKVPAGTHAGQTFRLKSKGFPEVGGYGFGDMLVKVVIDTPKNLTEEERQWIQKLSSLSSKAPLVKEFNEKMDKLLRERA